MNLSLAARDLVKLLFEGRLSVSNLGNFFHDQLVHLAELVLEIFVLSHVSPRKLLDLLSDVVQSFLERGLKQRSALLKDFGHLIDGAFPRAKLIALIVVWRHDEEEPLSRLVHFIVLGVTLVNIGREVAK